MPAPAPALAYQRYSNRTVTKRSGGRIEATELWLVPNIANGEFGLIGNDFPDTWHGAALSDTNLPQVGDISVSPGRMVCVSVTPRCLDNQGTAYVDIRWQEDPLTLPTEVHYFSQGKLKDAWRGLFSDCSSGAPDIPPTLSRNNLDIRNAAGDRFNPGVKYEAPLERIEIAFHCSLLWHDTGAGPAGVPAAGAFVGDWQNYVKHWNEDDFDVVTVDPDVPENTSTRTFPAGTLFFADKRAQLVKDPYLHRIVSCVFIYDPDTVGVRVPEMDARKYIAAAKPAGWPGIWPDKDGIYPVVDFIGRPYGGIAELNADGTLMLPNLPLPAVGPVIMPDPIVNAWFAVDDDGDPFSADFDDLDLFTPERDFT